MRYLANYSVALPAAAVIGVTLLEVQFSATPDVLSTQWGGATRCREGKGWKSSRGLIGGGLRSGLWVLPGPIGLWIVSRRKVSLGTT